MGVVLLLIAYKWRWAFHRSAQISGCYLHFAFQRSLQWYKTMLMLFKYVLKSVLHVPKCWNFQTSKLFEGSNTPCCWEHCNSTPCDEESCDTFVLATIQYHSLIKKCFIQGEQAIHGDLLITELCFNNFCFTAIYKNQPELHATETGESHSLFWHHTGLNRRQPLISLLRN